MENPLKNQRSRDLVLWGVSSVGGLLVNLALLTLWVNGLGVDPAVAIFPNWVLLAVGSYWFNDRVVFADHDAAETLIQHVRQLIGSEAIILTSKGVNYVIYLGLLRWIDYRVAWVVGAVSVFVLTFVLNRRWWRQSANRAVNQEQLACPPESRDVGE